MNNFGPEISQSASGEKSKDGPNENFMTKYGHYLVVPSALVVVVIYQLYFKKKTPKLDQQSGKQGPGQVRNRLNEQFQKQQQSLKGRFDQQKDRHSS